MTDSKAVEALALSVSNVYRDHEITFNDAANIANQLRICGYQILPTITEDPAMQGSSAAGATQSPGPERLREAVENLKDKHAVEWSDDWQTIEAAMSELAELRAAASDIRYSNEYLGKMLRAKLPTPPKEDGNDH